MSLDHILPSIPNARDCVPHARNPRAPALATAIVNSERLVKAIGGTVINRLLTHGSNSLKEDILTHYEDGAGKGVDGEVDY